MEHLLCPQCLCILPPKSHLTFITTLWSVRCLDKKTGSERWCLSRFLGLVPGTGRASIYKLSWPCQKLKGETRRPRIVILISNSCATSIHQGLALGRKHFLAIWRRSVNLTFLLLLVIFRATSIHHTFVFHTLCANNINNCSTWPRMCILSYVHLSLISLQYKQTIQTTVWYLIWEEWFPGQSHFGVNKDARFV